MPGKVQEIARKQNQPGSRALISRNEINNKILIFSLSLRLAAERVVE